VKKPGKLLNSLTHVLNVVAPEFRVDPGITVKIATRNAEVQDVDRTDTLYIDKVTVRWFRELDDAIKQAFEEIEITNDVPLLVMQGGDDKIVNKIAVKEWFNYAPLSEKRFKEWPKCYHEIFNDPEREEVFEYAKDFVYSQLKAIGYII